MHKEFNNYNVGYQLNANIDEPNEMFFMQSALQQSVMDAFHENKIEIRSPDYINIKDFGK